MAHTESVVSKPHCGIARAMVMLFHTIRGLCPQEIKHHLLAARSTSE